MSNHEKFINALLDNRILLSESERQSIARWPGQLSVCVECGWENGPSFRRIQNDEKTYDDINDGIKGLLDCSPLRIIATPAMYNMFAIQVAEKIAEFFMHMPQHPLLFLCCDEVLLEGIDEREIEENDCVFVDLSLVYVKANGMVVWKGDVPENVEAHLSRTNRITQIESRRAYLLDAMYPKSSSSSTYFTAIEKLYECSLDKLEDIASFYSYGNYIRCPQKKAPEAPSSGGNSTWLCDNVRFDKWEPDTDLVLNRKDYKLLRDAFKIWKHSYEGEFVITPDNSEFAEMKQFGHDSGVDSMVEALYAGVDLDDILA